MREAEVPVRYRSGSPAPAGIDVDVKQIALLSHRGGNIGHDMMAVGIEEAVREAFGAGVHITHFEQHLHFCVYPRGHPLRLAHLVSHGRLRTVRSWLAGKRLREALWKTLSALEFDVAIACGGPNLVPGGSSSAELRLMYLHLSGAFAHRGVPLVDAAIGSCFPWTGDVRDLQHFADRGFYREALGMCNRITVREPVAERVVESLGFDVQRIPCAAIGVGRLFEREGAFAQGSGDTLFINFQASGANEDWGQGVDPVAWRRTVAEVAYMLGGDGPIAFVAHNVREAELARSLDTGALVFQPTTMSEYAEVVGRARVAFVSRIHAGLAFAGAGVPCLVAGTDTRLETIRELGLPVVYAGDARVAAIVATLRKLSGARDQWRTRLVALREHSIRRYAAIFCEAANERR